MDTEEQRQRSCRGGDARLTKSGNARSEQLLMMPTESLTMQQRIVDKRALEWIGMSEVWLVFRYIKYQTCSAKFFLMANP